MIQPIQFLWRQLNGPQITAITQAIYHWIKDMFDDILDYFKYFRISSATFEHLQTIGVLNSFPLPILIKYKQQFFFFTYEKEADAEKGFASLEDRSIGGKFSSMEEHTAEETYLDAETYRELLQTVISCDCRPGSLRYLDRICKKIKDLGGVSADATYEYRYDERNPGSITVDIGYEGDWTDSMSVKAVINALAGSIYYPEPVLATELRTGDRPRAPHYQDFIVTEDMCPGIKKIIAVTVGHGTEGGGWTTDYYGGNGASVNAGTQSLQISYFDAQGNRHYQTDIEIPVTGYMYFRKEPNEDGTIDINPGEVLFSIVFPQYVTNIQSYTTPKRRNDAYRKTSVNNVAIDIYNNSPNLLAPYQNNRVQEGDTIRCHMYNEGNFISKVVAAPFAGYIVVVMPPVIFQSSDPMPWMKIVEFDESIYNS